jgi:RND family efflux transporter MFP subunit
MTPDVLRGVLLCCALGLGACSKEAPEEVTSETVVPVTVAPAQRGTITATVHATGVIAAAPGAELIVVAPEPARILEIPKAEGDSVRRGDLLVRFEIPSSAAEALKQRAEIGRAQARLATGKSAQARARDLFERGVAARREVEDAEREVANAEADLENARAAMTAAETLASRSVVRATFDGVIVKRSHNPGDLVEPAAADPVLRVVDPRRLEVAASIPIGDAPRIRLGARATLVDAPEGAAPATLKVASSPAAVQTGTATVPVRVAFSGPVHYPVGTPVQIEIDAESHSDVVLVRASAVVHEGQETAVFVVADNVAHRRIVKTGLEDDQRVEITNGIDAGDVVVTSGQNGLPDGAKVMVGQEKDQAEKPGAPEVGDR